MSCGLENSIDSQNYTIDLRNEELYSSIAHLIKDEIRSNLHGCAILSKCQYHGSQDLNILLHSKHFIRVSMKQHLESQGGMYKSGKCRLRISTVCKLLIDQNNLHERK